MALNTSLEMVTIHMSAPRIPIDIDQKSFVDQESDLRRSAYKNTTIKVDESFFDDSDMSSEYFLTLVYDKITNTPLLSSRYYFNRDIISKYLRGDNSFENKLIYRGKKFDLKEYPENIFLADRLSGNIKSPVYRYKRDEIMNLYYTQIVKNNYNSFLLLMVRKERGDKQLNKYLSIGFELMGSAGHKGKEHSIILGELKTWKL